jgi:hypothetical protein
MYKSKLQARNNLQQIKEGAQRGEVLELVSCNH